MSRRFEPSAPHFFIEKMGTLEYNGKGDYDAKTGGVKYAETVRGEQAVSLD